MRIKCLIMDVDGTLTDGKVYVGEEGEVFKAFNIRDGLGIKELLKENDIEPIIVTGRKSKIVSNRCGDLGVCKCYQGVDNKEKIIKAINNDLSKMAYIGDDINDLGAIEIIKEEGGLIGCPNDAVVEVKEVSDFVAPHNGGDGAVRDFIEWMIKN